MHGRGRPASSREEEKYSGCRSRYRLRRFLVRMRAAEAGDLDRGSAIVLMLGSGESSVDPVPAIWGNASDMAIVLARSACALSGEESGAKTRRIHQLLMTTNGITLGAGGSLDHRIVLVECGSSFAPQATVPGSFHGDRFRYSPSSNRFI